MYTYVGTYIYTEEAYSIRRHTHGEEIHAEVKYTRRRNTHGGTYT